MNRSLIPGLALALVVLVASVAALLLGTNPAARDDTQGAPLRPATSSQPLHLADPSPAPADDR
jgi:hypothetical protein